MGRRDLKEGMGWEVGEGCLGYYRKFGWWWMKGMFIGVRLLGRGDNKEYFEDDAGSSRGVFERCGVDDFLTVARVVNV